MGEHHSSKKLDSPNPRVRSTLEQSPIDQEMERTIPKSVAADLQRWRERMLNILLGIVIAGGCFVLIPSLIEVIQDPEQIVVEWPFFVAYAVAVMIFFMREFDYYLRLTIPVIIIYLAGILTVRATGVAGPGIWYLLLGPVLLFPLGGWRIGLSALVFSALVYVGFGVAHYQGWMAFQIPDPTDIEALLYFGMTYFLILVLIGIAQGMFNRAQEETLRTVGQRAEVLETSRQQSQRRADELASANRQLQRQTQQFNIVADVWEATRGIATLEAFLDHVVESIHQRLVDMGVVSVRVYMYDAALIKDRRGGAGRHLRLRAVSETVDASEVGDDVSLIGALSSEQRIPSLVSAVLYSQAARLSHINQKGMKQLALPLRFQPATSDTAQLDRNSEAVRGLRAEGVLFLQSSNPEAFHEADLDVWQVLADQLSIAIQNTFLLQQAQRQVREMQRLYQRYDQEIWQREGEQFKIFRYAEGEVSEEIEMVQPSGAMHTAVRDRHLIVDQEAQSGVARITVPITVRDAVIGVMNIEKSGERAQWSESQVDLVRMVNEQLELALDSARLFESTQMRAARERLVGDISSQMRTSVNLEDMLRTAVRELGQRLSLDEVVLELMTESGDRSNGG